MKSEDVKFSGDGWYYAVLDGEVTIVKISIYIHQDVKFFAVNTVGDDYTVGLDRCSMYEFYRIDLPTASELRIKEARTEIGKAK